MRGDGESAERLYGEGGEGRGIVRTQNRRGVH